MSISKTIAGTNAKALLLNPQKITCIYRGRNVAGFPVFHPPITDKPFIFLTVARLLKRKGYLELFEAAKLLQDKGLTFLIRIAGDGNDYPLFQERVKLLNIADKVEFLLNRKDVPALLAQAHCFIFPSHYEGQGGALVEAMLAAKPIIASDIPVFREQITHDQTGKLFQLFNVQDLADKMEWMLNNYSGGIMLGLNARRVAVERFNIENTVRLHEELYISILAK
jgi:glycosyltransferase involved in cell wall biosynthesis